MLPCGGVDILDRVSNPPTNSLPPALAGAAADKLAEVKASAASDTDVDTRTAKASARLVNQLRIIAAMRKTTVRELVDEAISDFIEGIGTDMQIPEVADLDPTEPLTSVRIRTAYADMLGLVSALTKHSMRDLADRAFTLYLKRAEKKLGWRFSR
jgi:hypothetical protein